MPMLIVSAIVALTLFTATGASARPFCSAPVFAPAESRFVADDGNNLRQWGGAQYASAPVLAVLNAATEVRLIRMDGKWAEVETREGLRGFVNAKCLVTYKDLVAGKIPDPRQIDLQGCDGGRKPIEIKADLDGDGKAETIRLTCDPGAGCVNYFLDVLSSDGRTLYKGPRYGDTTLIFCECNAGAWMPRAVTDLDGDGKAEILMTSPASDVSPVAFYLLRWNGSGFDMAMKDIGYFAEKSDPDFLKAVPYPKGEYPAPFRFAYIAEARPGGPLVVTIGGQDGGYGVAEVRFEPGGLRVVKWREAYRLD